jgi:hypothetical protein
MNSASLCSLAGRYDNPIPLRFLAPIDSLKIPALFNVAVQLLVQAGARADLYNDDLGLAPVHVACQQNRLDMLKVRRGPHVF